MTSRPGPARGIVTSTIHVLVVTPVIFYLMKVRALRAGRLTFSGMSHTDSKEPER